MAQAAGLRRRVRPDERRRSTRRALLAAAVAWPALAWTRAVLAQPKQKPATVGWLGLRSLEADADWLAAFKEGLAALGYREGQQFAIEGRWGESRRELMPSLAEALAARKPAVIVAVLTDAVRTAAKVAPGTPIVAVTGGLEHQTDLVKSFARPGGMVTGVNNQMTEVQDKYLELLVAAVPGLRRIGVLVPNANTPSPATSRFMEVARRSAAQHKVELRFEGAATIEEIEPAVTRLDKQGVQALIVYASQLFLAEAPRISKVALAHRWPLVGSSGLLPTESGALVTYGIDGKWPFRRAAHYVDRILKGAKPGDLPIEQPTKFELVVNLKNAKALGLTIPQPFLMRADRVIE